EAAAADADAAPEQHRPWYVSAMLGAAGWLAGFCAFFFAALLFEPDSVTSIATLGVVMLAAGFGLYAVSARHDNTFLDQLALAFSLGGQCFIVWASIDGTDSATDTAAIAMIMQIGIVLAFPNRFAKLLAAFLACVTWALTVRFALWGGGSL